MGKEIFFIGEPKEKEEYSACKVHFAQSLEHICSAEELKEEKRKIDKSEHVVVNWKKNKQNLLYLGMAFAAVKPITLANAHELKKTEHKSFENVLLYLHELYSANSMILDEEKEKIERIYHERRVEEKSKNEKIESFFFISPVREINEGEGKILKNFKENAKKAGYKVHFPLEDTNQQDNIGLRICKDNREAIRAKDAVVFYYNKKSEGSCFDCGMAFYLDKPFLILNHEMIDKNNGIEKIFSMMHKESEKNYEKEFRKIREIFATSC